MTLDPNAQDNAAYTGDDIPPNTSGDGNVSLPPVIPPSDPPQPPHPPNQPADDAKRWWQDRKFLLECLGFAVLCAYTWFACLQWLQIRYTNTLTARALDSANQNSLDSSKQFQVQLQRFDASLGQEQILAAQSATQALQTTNLASDTHALADSGRSQSVATQKIATNSAAQLTTMNQTLEIDHRAWVRVVDVVPENSLTLDDGAAQLNFAVSYVNIGNLPATNVLLKADMIAQRPKEGLIDLEIKETEFCEDAAKGLPISSDYTELLYPALGSEQHYIARTKLDNSYIQTFPGSDMKLLNLFIVGCLNYHFMSSTKDHQVGFIYQVQQKIPNSDKFFGSIRAGRSLETKDIALTPYFLGRKIAN